MLIDDGTHLEVLHRLAKELEDCIIEFNREANGLTAREALLTLRLKQNEVLTETLRRQRRHLRFMNGEKIEPETHELEAVLYAVGGFEA